jgi:hypothetical protein
MLLSERSGPAPCSVAVLAGLLRGEETSLEWLMNADNHAACVAAAQAHGVAGLLVQQLRHSSLPNPTAFMMRLTRVARAEVVIEHCHRLEVMRVLSALHDANVNTLIFKGTALAYTQYTHPSLRPRNDTDLLVKREDWDHAAQVLHRLGYNRKDEIRGDVARNQGEFVRQEQCVRHVVDLHWQISDRPVFAAALDFERLLQNAVEIPALGPVARTLAPVHALLLACMHRVRHYNADLLMWLYDIHLLTEKLNDREVDEFVAAARRSKISAICDAGLRRAAEHFHTKIPDGLLDRLRPAGAAHRAELSARYLVLPPWRARLLDLMTQPDWTKRFRFVCELATSDRQYLLDRYQRTGSAWLPVLYARRLVWRARKLLRSGASPARDSGLAAGIGSRQAHMSEGN